MEVPQWSDWSHQLGLGVFPEVVYGPADNLDVSLGAFISGGGEKALLGQWSDADQIYLRVKASF